MTDYLDKEIYFTLKEYKINYDKHLKEFLLKHDDFDEKDFIDLEMAFYRLCVENSTLIKDESSFNLSYSLNGGAIDMILPNIYDKIVTLEYENDGWDLELAFKFKSSFSKILIFLEDRKEMLNKLKVRKLNPYIVNIKNLKVRELFSLIHYDRISFFGVLDFLNKNTDDNTISIFLNDFYWSYEHYTNLFMLDLSVDEIAEAILNSERFEYIYVDKGQFSMVQHFVRDIGGKKTVYNVKGLDNFRTSDNQIELINLDVLMIDYCDGFFGHTIYGYENIDYFKHIYVSLKKHFNQKNEETENEKANINNHENELITKKTINEFQNPFPRIFTSVEAYQKFMRLMEVFKNESNFLADYSFIFHEMIYDGSIHANLKQKEYIEFLSTYKINLDRVKSKSQLGKTDLKKTIYKNAK